MGKTFFIIGGARSGKSAFALTLADGMEGTKTYIATAQAYDAEMEERIRNHKDERSEQWHTFEEPLEVAATIKKAGSGVALVDCVTLWLTNLMGADLKDSEIISKAADLSSACRQSAANIVIVSNEVGQGIVPDNPLARRFRDLSGKVNQLLAESADEVYFVAAGIPLKMK
ncbi:MAG: bifunctional adenosylcobinamide kinase/adenosylcobinamide-phosphate guanylyltransferase [Deltaproteobacteria bacterium]|nr:bifunctional adenosylcobinamide kinase/adenosylcobinamide-phosphate guanylyltransferase [Deltaproteobacteria bacterium]